MQDTRHIRIHVVGSMSMSNSSSSDNERRSGQSSSNSAPQKATITTHHHLPYQAGDIATILPSNPSSLVDRFLSILPASIRNMADDVLQITSSNNPNPNHNTATMIMCHPWPTSCTLRGLLMHCADLQSLPEREDLYALSSYCNTTSTSQQHANNNGQDQREKLISLSETSGAALYGDYIIREKRNWVDVFYDFDSIEITVEQLLGVLPSMKPRHFSIASSPSYIMKERQQQRQRQQRQLLQSTSSDTRDDGFELELCVAVVEGTTPFGRAYAGCCSKYLASIVPSSTKSNAVVRLWIHPGSFSKLPLDPPIDAGTSSNDRRFETPVMCIGAGTGIAPLRSLILEREAQLGAADVASSSHSEEGINCITTVAGGGNLDNTLVFGCRKQSKDYYYGKEWDALTSSKRLHFIPAFSRDQKHKLYVQRALREANGGELIVQHILERNGAVYVAGGSKMARAVKDEIVEALAARLDGEEKDAKRLLNKLKRKGLFSIEAWS